MKKVESAIALRALLGDIKECGDIGFAHQDDNSCFLALIDVLGHGAEAHQVGLRAIEYLQNNYGKQISDILVGLHEHIRGSRGAVVAIVYLDIETGKLTYTGIGNITIRILGVRATRMVLKDGIVGYGEIKPKTQELSLLPGDILLMHSDGLKEHFDVYECQDLLTESVEDIANGLINRYGLRNDDSSCVVLKYR